jgi:alpha-glucosidase
MGEWRPPPRQVIVELVGVGEQGLPDDGKGHTYSAILKYSQR